MEVLIMILKSMAMVLIFLVLGGLIAIIMKQMITEYYPVTKKELIVQEEPVKEMYILKSI